MKRNLDLIREILIAIEAHEPESVGGVLNISIKDFLGTDAQNYYHIEFLLREKFIILTSPPALTGDFSVGGLTMTGHDFLDAVREPTVWAATKDKLLAVGGWTLDIALNVATEELKSRLGLR